MSRPGQPVLRWTGSKRTLLPTLVAAAPTSYARYIEPFAGSACLLLTLGHSASVLADLNPNLINFYAQVQESAVGVHRIAVNAERRGDYVDSRRRYNRSKSPRERAGLFYYLNRHCFNGLYRENRSGEFNVPEGTRTGRLPGLAALTGLAESLRGCQLRCGDFSSTLADAAADDFVFADPPYFSSNRPFGEYAYGGFGDRDLPRFAKVASELDSGGVKVLIALPDRAEVRDLFHEWNLTEVTSPYRLAASVEKRMRGTQLLIRNYRS